MLKTFVKITLPNGSLAGGDYAEEGFESEEDWQDEYYGSCGTRIVEITEAEYKEETKPVWPFELVRKED